MSALDLPKPAWWTDEHSMLAESARSFLNKEFVPHLDRWSEAGIMDREAWIKAADAGLLSASIPEEYGGAGGNYSHEAVIAHEIGLAGADSWGWAIHGPIVAPYILHYGTDEQKKRWLPKMASGELIAALAMTEPGAGSDVQGIRTTAIRDGNHYVINGQKTFITNGQLADIIIVACKTDPKAGAKGVSLIIVEADREGFKRGRNLEKIGLKAQDTSELFFDNVRVPATNIIGDEGRGFAYMMNELPRERLLVSISAVAVMEAALRWTVPRGASLKAMTSRSGLKAKRSTGTRAETHAPQPSQEGR